MEKLVRNLILLGFGQDYYVRLSFTGQQHFSFYIEEAIS